MSPLHVVSITLDLYGIIICLVLIWSLLRGTVVQKSLNRLFIWMCSLNIGMLLGDIPNWLCEGFGQPWYPAALEAGCLLLYSCGFFLVCAYSKYVVYYLGAKVRVHKVFSLTVGVIAACFISCLILTQFNGLFYWIDKDNIYHRGDWYLLSQLLAVLILLVDTAMVLIYRKFLRKKELLAFSGYIILPIIAVVLQFFTYGLSLTYTASTLAILVIYTDVQSEQAFLVEQVERKLLQGKLSILLGQIKPHFMYNSLTAIANLCSTDATLAKEELINFTHYLRCNMNSLSEEAPIPFEKELEHTRYYLSMERLRFEERLQIEYHIGPMDFLIPPLTLQPLVENAVLHGIAQKVEGGAVTVGTRETEEDWLVTVTDDGPGFDTSDSSLKDGVMHMGIYNVQERLEHLCGGSLTFHSDKGEGTTATIRLPKRRNGI